MFKYIWDVLVGTGTQLRSLAMVFSHGSVSYTHLDVYKRQQLKGTL